MIIESIRGSKPALLFLLTTKIKLLMENEKITKGLNSSTILHNCHLILHVLILLVFVFGYQSLKGQSQHAPLIDNIDRTAHAYLNDLIVLPAEDVSQLDTDQDGIYEQVTICYNYVGYNNTLKTLEELYGQGEVVGTDQDIYWYGNLYTIILTRTRRETHCVIYTERNGF